MAVPGCIHSATFLVGLVIDGLLGTPAFCVEELLAIDLLCGSLYEPP